MIDKIPGAPPEKTSTGFIPLIVPQISGNEWAYTKECLDTGWVSSVGSFVDRFEGMLAHATGAKHAVATVNGTSALHIALLLAGVQPGDEVLVSTLTFIAPVNAIRYAGAWPVFFDAEPTYWQVDPERIRFFVEKDCVWDNRTLRNRRTGRRIAAVLPVHVLGHPVDLDPMLELAERYQLPVIEDATECLGATYKGRPAGRIGHLGCFSFNGNKIITTGGGGMLVTDRSDWAERAKYLTTQAKTDPLEYIHGEVGYNYRLTNIQAAVGCAQMEQLPSFINKKRAIAEVYAAALHGIQGISIMPEAPWAGSVYWMYTILVDAGVTGIGSRALLGALAKHGIQTRPLWQPIHRSPAHQSSTVWDCPVADRLSDQGLSLPCSVGLTTGEQARVIEALISRLDEAKTSR